MASLSPSFAKAVDHRGQPTFTIIKVVQIHKKTGNIAVKNITKLSKTHSNKKPVKKQLHTGANSHNNLSGIASYYGPGFNGKKTASGELFNQNAMTAAHRTLPMHSKVKVTNLKNNKSVIVRINDRGPWIHNRIMDLSRGAAKALNIDGIQKVSISMAD